MHRRPAGVVALSGFFAVGAIIASVTAIALLFPASRLEPLWQLNPQAHGAFLTIGPWAVVLMLVVAAAAPCQPSAFGLAPAGVIGWRSSSLP